MSHDELPEFQGYQMVDRVDVWHGLDFYLDDDGHVWIVDPQDGANYNAPHFLNHTEIRKIVQASGVLGP